jgi:glycosyltransferase involved in cell wall biosynthesis
MEEGFKYAFSEIILPTLTTPKVCVCTPTRNRKWTQEWSLSCLKDQDYKGEIQHIIIDNSDKPEDGWDTDIHFDEKKPVGWMRNECIRRFLETDAEFLVFWDDDDYYPPSRISSGVEALLNNPQMDIAASSAMYVFLSQENILCYISKHGDTHGTAATFTIRRKYLETHKFLDDKEKGEEAFFCNYWTAKMIQVPPEKTIVCIGHTSNTFSKSKLIETPTLFNCTILNADNGARAFQSKFPSVKWNLLKTTFSV